MNATDLCDNCIHQKVCKYSDHYIKTLRDRDYSEIFKISCKEYNPVAVFADETLVLGSDGRRYILPGRKQDEK